MYSDCIICIAIAQYQNQEIDTGKIYRAYSVSPASHAFICVPVCASACMHVFTDLCNFITSADECNHHHNQDIELFHQHNSCLGLPSYGCVLPPSPLATTNQSSITEFVESRMLHKLHHMIYNYRIF